MNLVERVYRIERSKNLEMNTRIYASALSSLTATILITLIGSGLAQEPNDTKIKGWPKQVKEIKYPANADKTLQPMLLRVASGKSKRPLLVGLHSWSRNYTQAGGEVVYARRCIEKDWHFIHPNFRGPNWTADACGSDKVVKDIVDAVAYMKKNHQVDADRIYLIGVSGGGHASLLMAGRAPDIWAGVSAWVPISDLQVWWKQKRTGSHSKYADHIEKSVGGRPDEVESAVRECVKRSPLTYLDKAVEVNLDINAGVTDGHAGGSVPFTHSLYAFNRVAAKKDRIPGGFIDAFYRKQALPADSEKPEMDSLYGKKRVLFRKVSGNNRVTIFQGKHEIIHHAGLNWLARQRRGKSAVWTVENEYHLKTEESEAESGN